MRLSNWQLDIALKAEENLTERLAKYAFVQLAIGHGATSSRNIVEKRIATLTPTNPKTRYRD